MIRHLLIHLSGDLILNEQFLKVASQIDGLLKTTAELIMTAVNDQKNGRFMPPFNKRYIAFNRGVKYIHAFKNKTLTVGQPVRRAESLERTLEHVFTERIRLSPK